MANKTTLSISIDPELKALAQEIAVEQKTSPSVLLSRYLESMALKRREELMRTYYETMNSENSEYNRKSLGIINRVVSGWGD